MYIYIYTYISVDLYIFYLCSYLAPQKKKASKSLAFRTQHSKVTATSIGVENSAGQLHISSKGKSHSDSLSTKYKHYVNISYNKCIYIYTYMCRYAIFINYVDTPHYVYIILEFSWSPQTPKPGFVNFHLASVYHMTWLMQEKGNVIFNSWFH